MCSILGFTRQQQKLYHVHVSRLHTRSSPDVFGLINSYLAADFGCTRDRRRRSRSHTSCNASCGARRRCWTRGGASCRGERIHGPEKVRFKRFKRLTGVVSTRCVYAAGTCTTSSAVALISVLCSALLCRCALGQTPSRAAHATCLQIIHVQSPDLLL
jgi:hypothetical protein